MNKVLLPRGQEPDKAHLGMDRTMVTYLLSELQKDNAYHVTLDNLFTSLANAYKMMSVLWIFFFSVLCLPCLLCLCARLFICTLWSPAGKGLTSWLSFMVSIGILVRCGT